MSEIEKIIRNNLKDELNKQIHNLEHNYNVGINELKETYNNLLSTLNQLELTDATLFDFFEKTDGNIRIKTLDKINWREEINITISG